jgi:hypothetical protein
MFEHSVFIRLGALVLLAGCGTVSGGGPRIDANLLSQEQILKEGPSNAYNIIEALRPTWLQKRGSTSFESEGEIRVYLDGTSLGGLEALRGLHSDNIQSIEFLDERKASFRFGPGHEHGVILVTLKR